MKLSVISDSSSSLANSCHNIKTDTIRTCKHGLKSYLEII
jgi:hypothetical protein